MVFGNNVDEEKNNIKREIPLPKIIIRRNKKNLKLNTSYYYYYINADGLNKRRKIIKIQLLRDKKKK